MATINNKKEITSHIIFKMQNEFFAINVSKVISILEMQKITQVPEAPVYMKGVINLRGEVLPVIDSHIKFGLPPMNITMNTSILVLEILTKSGIETKLGLMVDFVNEVTNITQDKILPPPSIGDTYESRFITGMYQKDEITFAMILDVDELLTINEIIELKATEHIEEIEKKTKTVKPEKKSK
jgi:purine-binding chemotaxis protein CheW